MRIKLGGDLILGLGKISNNHFVSVSGLAEKKLPKFIRYHFLENYKESIQTSVHYYNNNVCLEDINDVFEPRIFIDHSLASVVYT